MPSTTLTPQQTIEDRKVSGLLDDFLEDTCDCLETAENLSRSAVLRASTAIKSALTSGIRTLDSAMQKTETERGYVLDGKAKDLRKFKGYVETQLSALTDLEVLNGKAEAIEDAGIDALIVALLGTFALIGGSGAELKRLQVELAIIKKRLEAAVRVARDTKVKAAVGAALTAATMSLGPMSVGTAVLVYGGSLAVDKALDAVLAGREDTALKSAWGYASDVGGAADALDKLPPSFGPMMDIVSMAIDVSECFAAEADKAALIRQMDAFMKDFAKARAKFRADADKVQKMATDTKRKLDAAMSATNAVRPAKNKGHEVLRYL